MKTTQQIQQEINNLPNRNRVRKCRHDGNRPVYKRTDDLCIMALFAIYGVALIALGHAIVTVLEK